MGKRIIGRTKKTVAVFMSLVLVVGLTPMPAFAFAGEDEPDASAALVAGDGQFAVQDDGAVGASLGPLEIAIAKNLIEGVIYGAASGGASWTMQNLLGSLFGGALSNGNDAKLDEILKKLDQIEAEVKAISDKLTTIQLQEVLNDLHFILSDTRPATLYNALRKIDADLAGGKITGEKAKEARLTALTTAIGVDNPARFDTDFDQYVDKMWSAMTEQYNVTIGDQPQKLTLMQIYYELLRRTHKWENQAYEEWAAFQGSCVSLLMTSLTLEHASLQARIDQLEDQGKHEDAYAVFQRQQVITERIYEAAGFEGDIVAESPNGLGAYRKHVAYKGLFSEKTWESQYWMYKERPDYRYYWVPEHEILFYAKVNTQDVPQEPKGLGLTDDDYLKGIKVSWREGDRSIFDAYDVSINYDYWKPFLRYQGGESPLVSVDQLKQIYKDYGSSTHLYKIFIDKNEGNFLGLDEGNMENWWFVVDQDKGHHLTYKKHTFKADELYCYVVVSGTAKTTTVDLCKYHRSSHEGNKHRHYIGIGVARVGAETYNPDKMEAIPNLAAQAHTAVEYDSTLWWATRGDMTLTYNSATHGKVLQATMDGELIDESNLKVDGDNVVLSEAFMKSLDYGRHELELECENGNHAITFYADAQVMYRLYNPYSGEHHYTADATEIESLIEAGWTEEGEAWVAPVSSDAPVYRLYNPNEPLGDHHYTTDEDEYDALVAAGWTGEDVGWYSDIAEGVPLYRVYNPNAYAMGMSGAHHYTADENEAAGLVAAGWVSEDIAWYGVG